MITFSINEKLNNVTTDLQQQVLVYTVTALVCLTSLNVTLEKIETPQIKSKQTRKTNSFSPVFIFKDKTIAQSVIPNTSFIDSVPIEVYMMSKKTDRFRLLPENWNGYGAKPLSDKLINDTIIDISRLFTAIGLEYANDFDVFPTPRNSIQLEVEYPDLGYLEIEIFETQMDILVEDATGSQVENDNLNLDGVIQLVRQFYNQPQ